MDFSGFDLEKTASPNYMGLVGTIAGTKGLVVGWDQKEYTLELENGERVKTADFVWEYETLADEDVMESNARVAALRSESSPFKDEGRLSYDHITGAWDIVSADPLEEESDPEFGGDDDDEDNIEVPPEPEDEDGEEDDPASQIQTFLESLESLLGDHEAAHGDTAGLDNHPLMQALPYLIVGASDPDLDATQCPEVQRYLDYLDQDKVDDEASTHEHFEAKVAAVAAIPLAEEAAVPALEAAGAGGAVEGLGGMLAKIPGSSAAAKFLSPALKSLGVQSLLGGAMGGGSPQDTIQVQRQKDFSYSHMRDAGTSVEDSFLGIEKKADAGADIVDAMRQQVVNVLQGIAGKTKDMPLDADAAWYVFLDSATTTKSVTTLQSILQAIPEEYHNVQPNTPQIEDPVSPMALPSAMPGGSKPMVPGGEVSPEPAGPGANPLGGGALVPGGPGAPPPGTAPGGGIPGGPGRRAPMSSVTAAPYSPPVFDPVIYHQQPTTHHGDLGTGGTITAIALGVAIPLLSYAVSVGWDGAAYWRDSRKKAKLLKALRDIDPSLADYYERGLYSTRQIKEQLEKLKPKDQSLFRDESYSPISSVKLADYVLDEQPYLAKVENMMRHGFTDSDIVASLTHEDGVAPKDVLYYLKEVKASFKTSKVSIEFLSEIGVKQAADAYQPLNVAPTPTTQTTPTSTPSGPPPVQFGVGDNQAQTTTDIQQAAAAYIAKGMPVAQAYQQAALDHSQPAAGGINVGAPTAPVGYGMTAAAQGMAELPIDQDGKKMADLQCPRCGGHTIGYAGDDDFVCRTCGKEFSHTTQADKTSAAQGMAELPIDQDGKRMADLKCPRCGGHTIGYAGEDDFVCRTCGKEFSHATQADESSVTSKVASWRDSAGNPLEVGKLYKMTHPEYPVPDFVKVTWVEPENIRVGFVNNGTEDDIHSSDYSFELVEDDASHTSSTDLSWLMDGSQPVDDEPLVAPLDKLAGRHFDHSEQRSFIDEEGVARNKDKLNLSGTHYNAPTEIKPSSNAGNIDLDNFLIGG